MTRHGVNSRLVAPDLGRGLMLAWIAVANVALFVLGPYGPRQHVVEDGLADRLVTVLVVGLVDGRAYPLFALLYGYGVARLLQRSDAGPVVLRRRSVGLILVGAVHAVLLFPGDILGLYGVLGFVLVACRSVTDRTLTLWAMAWLVPACAVTAIVHGSSGGGEQRTYLWSFALSDPAAVFPLRAVEWLMTPFALLPVVSAALVGVLAARHRLPERAAELHDRLRSAARVLLGAAVLGGLPSGLVVAGFVPAPGPVGLVALAFVHAVTGVAGGVGAAALLVLFADRAGSWATPMIALGRRSLSGYLFLSLVFAVVLHPLGLGLGERWGTAATTGFAVAVWMAAVGLAAGLARAGRPGPAELVLRRLSGQASWQDAPGRSPDGRT
ncbi:DUF418 domain-containing protein [Pseudonocardia parietis]|uniref:Membrane protein YeiB n=1 Tax=Pseudonocardia parietis TaxID=570936 RepID=A0ABS4VZ12_9PSEU|nr:DUF418 domain-containing protein [Pseudonocardia parietis]MBP2369154.1 putative membrane protein YeiB [Pseudonocardia parietis]